MQADFSASLSTVQQEHKRELMLRTNLRGQQKSMASPSKNIMQTISLPEQTI